MARWTGQHPRAVWLESWALTLHTFTTLVEADRLEALVEDGRDIDRAALQAIAFHDPKRLKEEYSRHQKRVQKLADPEGTHRAAEKKRSEELIARMTQGLGGAPDA